MTEDQKSLDKQRREARDTLLQYERLLTGEAEPSGELPGRRLLPEGLATDARRLTGSRDPDIREAGLYLATLLSPEGQAHLFSTLEKDNRDAKRAFARFVDAECLLIGAPGKITDLQDVVRRVGGAGLEQALDGLRAALVERSQWKQRLFEALDGAHEAELNALLDEVDRKTASLRPQSSGNVE